MANQHHLEVLKPKGQVWPQVHIWNRWILEYYHNDVDGTDCPDLSGTDFRGNDLRRIDFATSNLKRINLSTGYHKCFPSLTMPTREERLTVSHATGQSVHREREGINVPNSAWVTSLTA
jgi:hypothetical protein